MDLPPTSTNVHRHVDVLRTTTNQPSTHQQVHNPTHVHHGLMKGILKLKKYYSGLVCGAAEDDAAEAAWQQEKAKYHSTKRIASLKSMRTASVKRCVIFMNKLHDTNDTLCQVHGHTYKVQRLSELMLNYVLCRLELLDLAKQMREHGHLPEV